MKLGRFIVDTHVHSQRHAAGASLKGSTAYGDLGRSMLNVTAYDNSPRLLYDMECYGIDFCITQPAFSFGMVPEIGAEQAKKYPDKFAANCYARVTRDRAVAGEIEWKVETAIEELEGYLKTGDYVGIGENMPAGVMWQPPGEERKLKNEVTIMKEIMMIADLCRSYKIPLRYHAGLVVGYEFAYNYWPSNFNPLWAHDVAVNFPDVPLIMEHGWRICW